MPASVSVERQTIHLLNNLIQLDLAEIEAYRAVIERVRDPAENATVRGFMADHERHVRDLTSLMRQLGGTPPSRGRDACILSKDATLIASLDDLDAISFAMMANEGCGHGAYSSACAGSEMATGVRDVLARALADEVRHREYFETRARNSPVPPTRS